MSRAIRRHHAKRIKDRVRRMIKDTWGDLYQTTVDDPRHVGMVAHTPKTCSCPCCGNPRKHFGLKTRQELKEEE
jgi:hypothetical protein